MVAPDLTIRWQVRSTARSRGTRKAIGAEFQRWLSIDPAGEPWNDEWVKAKFRKLGLGLVLVSTVIGLVGVQIVVSH